MKHFLTADWSVGGASVQQTVSIGRLVSLAPDFVEQNYVTLKKSNPDFPILVRECSGVQARLWARYEFGKETSVSVENMSADQVGQALQTLAQSKP
uniref:NADH dehydrogenase [ubiquinone] 1 alpha subcomplex subunit 2 n=1 Tax=Acanthochromis polyacanthus TaxID=80966 RepID=A0A3Q1G5W2_9TELE